MILKKDFSRFEKESSIVSGDGPLYFSSFSSPRRYPFYLETTPDKMNVFVYVLIDYEWNR